VNTVFFDSGATDDERRQLLYEGQLFVYSPRPSTLALCRFARELIEQAFPGLDPRKAQHSMGVSEYAAVLGRLKPQFIHHDQSKDCIKEVLRDVGCELERTFFDVPRLRSSTSDGYLTTGIAYAWHPHRDTWYSAPPCQVNWWIPVYEIESSNAMAFHPRYWTRPVANDSRAYDYAEWNRRYRYNAEQFTKEDPRPLPRSTEPVEIDPQLRIVAPVGSLLLFSGAQMHSSVPNTSGMTRFSIDFRTVHLDDVAAFRGAPNVDSACTGTTMADYLRATDLSHIPQDLIDVYETRGVRVATSE
jgi:hypothetical protein